MKNEHIKITVDLDMNLIKNLEVLSLEIKKNKSEVLAEALKMYKENTEKNKDSRTRIKSV